MRIINTGPSLDGILSSFHNTVKQLDDYVQSQLGIIDRKATQVDKLKAKAARINGQAFVIDGGSFVHHDNIDKARQTRNKIAELIGAE